MTTEDDGSRRPPLDIPAGQRVGEWTITQPIGHGSWGSVYAAEGPDGEAAVKFPHTGSPPPEQEVRFSLAARHANLIRTHTAIPMRDGSIALVMDRAAHSVRDLLATATPGRAVPEAERILRGVGAGLAHLHTQGWVHADLKPANVLIGPQRQVWVSDFGLTAELDGTHAYMQPFASPDHVPPEWWSQRVGIRGRAVRQTADIWAFGVLAHQLLSGGLHPFPGAAARARALAAQSYARGQTPLRLDGTIPEGWRQLIAACLAPDHATRSRLDAAKLAEQVTALCAGRPARRRAPAGMGTALAIAVAGSLLAGDSPLPTLATTRPPATPVSATGIPARSDVPVALRPYITKAVRGCTEQEVTAPLIAAMLKAESGFNANARRPSTKEYGIAMWTPSVFPSWAVPGHTNYMSPPDAIAAMGNYLCWIDQQLKSAGVHQDLPALIAAGYRTSARTVTDVGGVPARTQQYIAKFRRYYADYSQ